MLNTYHSLEPSKEKLKNILKEAWVLFLQQIDPGPSLLGISPTRDHKHTSTNNNLKGRLWQF